ncbi:flagellar basal body-associated protein FliL [Marinomonas spartinae]|uniref:Flagellar protein FliL n=1 Tax=Marinomonas spartinae TaxID=1792290 RepID=A0A1A8THK9_9GAMM|nr:flagellar basal body-associated FliL family protein [Marinomonas spartinae]SBS26441.1 flagellar basal body-associated protein FliL [Marinomonas spartinae]SBS32746.1 flagellar basal body-associated protein FliL [Marinomonas spartinae]
MAEEDNLEVDAEEGKKGGKKKLIIIIALAVVLLGGGGAAAYFFFFSGSDEAASAEADGGASSAEAAAELSKQPSIYLKFDEPFVLDFVVDGQQRYLQLTMTVKSKDQSQIDALKLNMPLIRNSLVLLFSSQSFNDLKTMEGKLALKKSALEAINKLLKQQTGKGGIDAVLFTSFVMQ